MKCVILTGISGAGKTTASKMFEDMGYYCVDNLPVPLLSGFMEIFGNGRDAEIEKVALGIDIRSGRDLDILPGILDSLRAKGSQFTILFLDASDDALVKRYKETRRTHPLSGNGRIEDGIRSEREKLAYLKSEADFVIDTTRLLTRELKGELEKIFVSGSDYKSLYVTILSFGFKYGIPADADLVFDVRFLPNPYYVEGLRHMTGNDADVQEFVFKFPEAGVFAGKLEDMARFLIPNYIKEGKTQLVIAIGCTGGKHRSVAFAGELYKRLSENADFGLRVEHRDIDKDARRGK